MMSIELRKVFNLIIVLGISIQFSIGQDIQPDSMLNSIELVSFLNPKNSRSSNEEIFIEKIQPNGSLQILSLIQNRNSSLSINNNSGSPGASISAIIRGRKSFHNSVSPLIILDGLPIDNSEWGNSNTGTDQSNRLIDINPAEIASVEIIKGSVGAVLYGIRGANGVLILKSKKGKISSPKIQISSEVTVSKVGKLPLRQSIYSQGHSGSYRGPGFARGLSWGPEISSLEYDGDTDYPYDKNGFLVPKGQGNGTAAKAYDPYVFFQNAISRNLNASLSGGNKSINYYVSGGHNKTNGVIPKSDYTRNSVLGRISANLNKKISIEATGRLISSNANRVHKGSNINGVMLGLLRNSPTFDITNGLEPAEAVDDISAYTLSDGSPRSFRPGVYDNPYWTINNNPNDHKINRFLGSTSLRYILNDNISVKASGGIDSYVDSRKGGIERFDDEYDSHLGSAYERTRDFQASNMEVITEFKKVFFTNFDTKFQLGANYFTSKIKDSTVEGEGLMSRGSVTLDNTLSKTTSLNAVSARNFGAFSSLDINAYDAFNLTISARQDYSSLSGSNQQGFLSYGFHSSIDLLSLLNSNKPSSNDPQFIIFAGIGRSGMAAPVFASRSYFVPAIISGDGFLVNEELENTLERSDLAGNPELKAEKTDAFEVGINTSFLSNKIGIRITYFNEKSSDVILLHEVARSSGFSSIYDNVATIRNKGIELLLYLNPIKTNNFSWEVSTHFNAAKNKVEEIDLIRKTDFSLNGLTSITSTFIEGQNYGVVYGNGFLTNKENEVIIGSDGFPIIDYKDRKLGDPNPDFTIGLENQFRIGKNLRISLLMDFKKGGEMYCGTCDIMNYFGVSQLSADERNQTMVFDGVTESGDVNTISVNLADPDQLVNSYYRVRYGFSGLLSENIFDASWVRIRRLDLTYDFTSKLEKVRFIDAFKVALFADNLWLSTKYPGIDPETNLSGNSNGFGIDYFNNPSTRSVGISLTLTL